MIWKVVFCFLIRTLCRPAQARQQLKEMVWMKSSENMVLEAMFRLSGLHDALEELLRAPALPPGPTR